MSKYLAIRQNKQKLITSFEYIESGQLQQYVSNFKKEVQRMLGSRCVIEEEHDGDSIIYIVNDEHSDYFSESLSIIDTKKD